MGLKEEILALPDAERKQVVVPEWGELGKRIYVRALSARGRDAWESDMQERKEGGDRKRFYDNFRARLVALTVVDEAGAPVFSFEDAEALGDKSSKAIGALFSAACELNGLTAPEVEEHAKK